MEMLIFQQNINIWDVPRQTNQRFTQNSSGWILVNFCLKCLLLIFFFRPVWDDRSFKMADENEKRRKYKIV